LKNEDVAAKFKLGTDLYEAEKFEKANRLFLQIVPKYRGKPQAEKLMYMHSKAFYETQDYYTANYKLEQFVESYPKSERVDEIAYLGAKSYYYLSPAYSRDQTETYDALEKLQLFINKYPDSKYFDEANALIQELDLRLEKRPTKLRCSTTPQVLSIEITTRPSLLSTILLKIFQALFTEKMLFFTSLTPPTN
jgi:outer membrane protein assembly factor BamD